MISFNTHFCLFFYSVFFTTRSAIVPTFAYPLFLLRTVTVEFIIPMDPNQVNTEENAD